MSSSYINNGQYENLKTFITDAMYALESTYVKYNTGNLVIDSFLTNYDTIATKNNIRFSARLDIDFKRIPINDYDLCVILGNILDNSMNACRLSTSDNKYISFHMETTDNDKFTIHEENTTPSDPLTDVRSDSINHGLGLGNIQRTVEKNLGFVTHQIDDDVFHIDITIPIIEDSQRTAHMYKRIE